MQRGRRQDSTEGPPVLFEVGRMRDCQQSSAPCSNVQIRARPSPARDKRARCSQSLVNPLAGLTRLGEGGRGLPLEWYQANLGELSHVLNGPFAPPSPAMVRRSDFEPADLPCRLPLCRPSSVVRLSRVLAALHITDRPPGTGGGPACLRHASGYPLAVRGRVAHFGQPVPDWEGKI